MTLEQAFERCATVSDVLECLFEDCADVQADIREKRNATDNHEYKRRLRRAAKYLDIVMTEIEEAIECTTDTQ